MQKQKKKIVVCGGGTAGHIYPALAIIDELKKNIKNLEVFFIGSGNKIEKNILQNKNINLIAIPTGKIRRSFHPESIIKNIIDLFKLPLGFIKSIIILKKIKPDLIFSKGGYASLLPVLAGYFLKIPIIIHESDIKIGLANKIASFFATKIAVSFPENYYPSIPKEKLIFTGNPLRKEIFKTPKEKALNFFNLSSQKKTLGIIGGSQGSRKINYTILEILPQLLKDFQVIHISGWLDYEDLKNKIKKLPKNLLKNYRLLPYLEEIGLFYIISDFFISRAGANVIFEICQTQKPAIFIPLPGHQEKNAAFLEKYGNYIIIKNDKLSPTILSEKIKLLTKKKAIPPKIFPKNPNAKIAQIIKEVMQNNQ